MYEFAPIHAILQELEGKKTITQKRMLEVFGVNRSELKEALATGVVGDFVADQMAVSLGLHPAEVYGVDAWIKGIS